MENIINTTILGIFFGTIGTTIGGIIGCTIKNTSNKFLSFILSFAAGAMVYVIVEELIPESQMGEHSNIGTIGAAIGFMLMMVLDVALG